MCASLGACTQPPFALCGVVTIVLVIPGRFCFRYNALTSYCGRRCCINGVEPRNIDSTRGILLGWSRDFQTEAVIILSPGAGLRVWYQHNLGQCKICPDRRQCKLALLRSVHDLGVSLTRQERDLEPSKLSTSSLMFSRALGRDEKKKTF